MVNKLVRNASRESQILLDIESLIEVESDTGDQLVVAPVALRKRRATEAENEKGSGSGGENLKLPDHVLSPSQRLEARVTNSALAFAYIRIMRSYIAQWYSGMKSSV